MGVGKLGGKARFIGKRGNDQLGILFEEAVKKNNVEPVLTQSQTPTGRVLSIITPDAQRTMFTFLGASSETAPEELVAEKFKGAAIVHIEGYMLFNEKLIITALKAAKNSGALISLDLASFTVVEAAKNILADLIHDYVDILIANENEAFAYTGKQDELEALTILARQSAIAVVKVGKRGSYIAHKGTVHIIGILGDGKAVDTTGAGDLWASGFLYGLIRNYPMEKCGFIGAACGYEVCQVIGAQIPEAGWQRIKPYL
jgi:sugar/nucleoside kinase (ribokinase family)